MRLTFYFLLSPFPGSQKIFFVFNGWQLQEDGSNAEADSSFISGTYSFMSSDLNVPDVQTAWKSFNFSKPSPDAVAILSHYVSKESI